LPGIPAAYWVSDMEFADVAEAVKAHDTITIFRHVHPDCDAMGSQAALKQWLLENYPEKHIYALGAETMSHPVFPEMDEVNDEVIRSSLAVVLDVGDAERVDDGRFQSAEEIIKIDHHPERSQIAQISHTDVHAAATCEILSRFFREQGLIMSRKTATFLYRGLLTDTLCFRTTNTTSATLEAASWITSYQIDIPGINRELFDQSLQEFRFASWLRSKIQSKGEHLAYCIVSLEDEEQWKISADEARNFIDELGHVREYEIWCLFTEKEKDGKRWFDGSLRSKSITINQIANQYSGGGHKNAAGVKNLDEEKLKSLLSSLFSAIHNN
jgi:phosphoesterase RecJ-like protein